MSNKSIKFLCITPSYYPAIQFGGPIQALRSLLINLSNNNFNISVITTNKGCESINSTKNSKVDDINVTYHNSSKFFDNFNNTGWHFSLSLFKQVMYESSNHDIIYCRALWNFPTLVAYFFAKINKTPLIIAATGKLYPVIINNMSYKKKIYWHLFIRRILSYSYIHFTSEQERNKCTSLLKNKNQSLIINTGTSLIERKSDLLEKTNGIKKIDKSINTLLFLGRIHPIKGLEDLIKTFNEVLKFYPNTALIIAGPDEGVYKNQLIKLSKILDLEYMDLKCMRIPETDISKKIIFTGLVNEVEKVWLLDNCDIYTQFSISEGFSNSIIEAMAMEKPVSVSIGCNFPAIDQNNLGLIGNGVNKHTKNIVSLIDNKELAKNYGINGFKYIQENYSWQKIAKIASEQINHIV